MKVIEKGKDGAEPVHMGWDASLSALASDAYDPVPLGGERDVDQPGAQAPAPGVDPVGGKEKAAEGHVLTNMTDVTAPETTSSGLPKSPPLAQPASVKAPATPAPSPKPDAKP